MGATQLGDVVDAPEGHRELFTRGADEHDRSVTESEVVGAHRGVMQLGVRRQSGVLLAVNGSEPKFPPAGFGGAIRVFVRRVRPQLSDRCATDRGNTLDKSRVLRLPFCDLGRLDVLLKLLEKELLLPFGDEDRRVCDLTCWVDSCWTATSSGWAPGRRDSKLSNIKSRPGKEAKVRYVPVVSGSSTGGTQAASNS